MDMTELRARYEYHKTLLGKLQAAMIALIDGGVQSYTIDDRTLTRLDLASLRKQLKDEEKKVDELAAMLNGLKPRRAVGVLPRDW